MLLFILFALPKNKIFETPNEESPPFDDLWCFHDVLGLGTHHHQKKQKLLCSSAYHELLNPLPPPLTTSSPDGWNCYFFLDKRNFYGCLKMATQGVVREIPSNIFLFKIICSCRRDMPEQHSVPFLSC